MKLNVNMFTVFVLFHPVWFLNVARLSVARLSVAAVNCRPMNWLKYVKTLGEIIIGDPYPPSNAIIYRYFYVSLGNNFFTIFVEAP